MAAVQRSRALIAIMTSRNQNKPSSSTEDLRWRVLSDRLQALEAWVIANDVMMKAIYAAYPGSSGVLDELESMLMAWETRNTPAAQSRVATESRNRLRMTIAELRQSTPRALRES
jgi:hypothetical protein